MDLVVAKILSALLLWILSLGCGLLAPFLIWKSKAGHQQPTHQQESEGERERLLPDEEATRDYQTTNYGSGEGTAESAQNCFSRFLRRLVAYDISSFIKCWCGGLFLGICFLDLLPESQEGIQDLEFQTTFPITELLIALGLLLVMFVEISVNALCLHRWGAIGNASYDEIEEPSVSSNNSSRLLAQSEPSEPEANHHLSHANITVTVTPATDKVNRRSEAIRSLVLVTMLSFHSIFEGLALGLERTIADLIQLLVAIAVHKGFLAFGIGVKLFETFTPTRVMVAVVCSFIFCTGSPLGCAIGIVISLGQNNSTVPNISDIATVEPAALSLSSFGQISGTSYASAILECLATGTLFYVTFVEVIPSEFSHTPDESMLDERNNSGGRLSGKLPIKPVVKLTALIFGFATVTALWFV